MTTLDQAEITEHLREIRLALDKIEIKTTSLDQVTRSIYVCDIFAAIENMAAAIENVRIDSKEREGIAA